MFNSKKYSKAFTEVEEIISILATPLKERIPSEVVKAISENKDKNYKFEYDHTKSIDNQDITEETKVILATIYREYICSEEEKQKWKEYDRFRLNKMEYLKKKNYNGN